MQVKSDKSDKKSNIQEQERTTLMKVRFLETLGMDRVAGNVLVAANATGLSRDTVYRWRNEDPEFATKWQEAITMAVDKKVDLAEDKLHELVMKGNITAIIHTLRRYRPEIWDRKHSNDQVVSTPLHKMSPRFAKVMERLMANHESNSDSNSA